MYSGLFLHTGSSPDTLRRLVASEESCRSVVRSRNVIRHASSVIIGHIQPSVGMCLGLDCSDLLPPFFPNGRNEDGLFGQMVERCVPDACAAHLPWAIEHNPPGARMYATDAGSRIRISDVISACVLNWPGTLVEKTTAGALRSLGRHLTALAASGPDELQEVIHHEVRRVASARIQRNSSLLTRNSDFPGYWREEVLRQSDQYCKGMIDPAYPLPVDLGFPDDEAPARVLDLVKRFGKLVTAWPDMIDAAIRLQAEGIQPGVDI